MKMLLKDVVVLAQGLRSLATLSLPVRLSFRLSKFIKAVEVEMKELDEQRAKLLKEYGKEKKDQPGAYTIEGENVLVFNKNMEELVSLEVDLPDFEKIKVSEFGENKLTVADFMALESIIEE